MNYTFLFGISCNSGRDLAFLLHRNILCKFAAHVHTEHQSTLVEATLHNVECFYIFCDFFCSLSSSIAFFCLSTV